MYASKGAALWLWDVPFALMFVGRFTGLGLLSGLGTHLGS